MEGESAFGDGKDEGALRTIGELCDALALKPHVLRYWEDQFPQLKPLKRSGGRRYYRAEDVALVREIDRLVNGQGYTLRGARAALRDFKPSEGGAVLADSPAIDRPAAADDSAPASAVPAELVARLQGIRDRLAAAFAA